jgi:hypothetical protein
MLALTVGVLDEAEAEVGTEEEEGAEQRQEAQKVVLAGAIKPVVGQH